MFVFVFVWVKTATRLQYVLQGTLKFPFGGVLPADFQ